MDAAPPDAPSPAPVVWLAPARGAADRQALSEWALARGVRLAIPPDGRAPAVAVDLAIATSVEDELERARDALSSQEADATERALTRAGELLRAHPELPNAAWLMAEVDRAWSARWRRLEPKDAARGDAAWRKAAALDGGRVAGVGETSARGEATVVAARIVVDGGGDAVHVRLDGGPLVNKPAGEHVLTIAVAGELRYAAWIALAEGAVVKVHVPSAPACSSGDLASAEQDGAGVRAPLVLCPRWVAVAPLGAGLGVATCEGAACGPLAEWRVGGAAQTDVWNVGRADEPAAPRWPFWATGAVVAAGVALATGITLVATGAFEKQRTETHFVNGGLRIQSF